MKLCLNYLRKKCQVKHNTLLHEETSSLTTSRQTENVKLKTLAENLNVSKICIDLPVFGVNQVPSNIKSKTQTTI